MFIQIYPAGFARPMASPRRVLAVGFGGARSEPEPLRTFGGALCGAFARLQRRFRRHP